MNLRNHIESAIGDGLLSQNIVDAGLEIVHAETEAELLAAAKRYQNFVMIAARGRQMNESSRISRALRQHQATEAMLTGGRA